MLFRSEFKHLLKEYIKYIQTHFVEFDLTSYKYKFHSYPKLGLSFEDIKNLIENDHTFKTKSRPDKENIINKISDLIDEINSNSERLKQDYLNCFSCGESIQSHNIEQLNYIKCQSCGCLIDSSNPTKTVVKIDDSNLTALSAIDFGMDYLTLNQSDL